MGTGNISAICFCVQLMSELPSDHLRREWEISQESPRSEINWAYGWIFLDIRPSLHCLLQRDSRSMLQLLKSPNENSAATSPPSSCCRPHSLLSDALNILAHTLSLSCVPHNETRTCLGYTVYVQLICINVNIAWMFTLALFYTFQTRGLIVWWYFGNIVLETYVPRKPH